MCGARVSLGFLVRFKAHRLNLIGSGGLSDKVLGTDATELAFVDGLEGHGREDGTPVRVLKELSGSAVEGDSSDEHTPATSKLLKVDGSLRVGVLSTSKEPEEESEGKEERRDRRVHGERAKPENEGDDTPDGKHDLLTVLTDSIVSGVRSGLVDLGSNESTMDGN